MERPLLLLALAGASASCGPEEVAQRYQGNLAGVATTDGVADHTLVLGGAFVTVYRTEGVVTRIEYNDTCSVRVTASGATLTPDAFQTCTGSVGFSMRVDANTVRLGSVSRTFTPGAVTFRDLPNGRIETAVSGELRTTSSGIPQTTVLRLSFSSLGL